MTNSIPKLTVESVSNHIYFYSEIDPDRSLALMRELRELDASLRADQLTKESEGVVPIWLHINSPGGSLMDGFALADAIELLPTPVYSVVEGMAASAGSIVAMACKKRYIMPNSWVMLHELSTWFYGKESELKDHAKLSKNMMRQLVNFYVAHCKLSRTAIKEMLKHDTWLDADQALEAGMIDEIKR